MKKAYLAILYVIALFASYTLIAANAALTDTELQKIATAQLVRINNYESLSEVQKIYWQSRIFKWVKRIDALKSKQDAYKLPLDLFAIHSEIIHIASYKNEINMVPGLDIAYVPDPDLLYLVYLKYYESILKYGDHSPIPELVLSILSRETKFLWSIGDNGMSVGPCQLHRNTALWLLKSADYKPTFRKYIYFEDNDFGKMHHFRSKEQMVTFVFEFLQMVKQYRKGNELQAIAAYNGSGAKGVYAQNVARNSFAYIALREMNQNVYANYILSDTDIAQRITDIISAAFANHNFDALELDSVICAVSVTAKNTYNYSAAKQKGNVFDEITSTSVERYYTKVFLSILGVGKAYIYKTPDVYLFSCFRENLSEAVFYHNQIYSELSGKKQYYAKSKMDKGFIYLYYFIIDPETGKTNKQFVTSVKQYKILADKVSIQTSFDKGKIYIKPDLPVYHYHDPFVQNLPPAFFVEHNKIADLVHENIFK